jgi:hypothetical protein
VKPTALALAAVLALSLAGCGGDDEPSDARTPGPTPTLPVAVGTVQGRFVVERGVLEPTTTSGVLTIKGPDGSVLNADIKDDGRFAIQLPPGEYTITATTPTYLDGRPCGTTPAVTVLVAERTVETDVICRSD